MNSTPMENFIITDFSLDTILAYQLPCVTLAGDSPTAIPPARTAMEVDEHVLVETKKKRKAMEQSTCKSQIISPSVSTTEFEGNTKYRLGKVKKSKEAEETIHVRARRGQATDSHSLAERFLSMELAAASCYDFNFETEGIKMAQEGTNSQVAQQQQQIEKWDWLWSGFKP